MVVDTGLCCLHHKCLYDVPLQGHRLHLQNRSLKFQIQRACNHGMGCVRCWEHGQWFYNRRGCDSWSTPQIREKADATWEGATVILRSERVHHAVVPTYGIVRRLLIRVAAAIMEGEEGLGGWGATPVEGRQRDGGTVWLAKAKPTASAGVVGARLAARKDLEESALRRGSWSRRSFFSLMKDVTRGEDGLRPVFSFSMWWERYLINP
jgi:hypothetical protein